MLMSSRQMTLKTESSVALKIVSVSDLKLGMVIHSIAQQSGKLGVKHKGSIKHIDVITQLKASGVESVFVECKKVKNITAECIEQAKPMTPSSSTTVDTIKSTHTNQVVRSPSVIHALKNHDNLAFTAAESLLHKSQDIFQKLTLDLAQHRQINLTDSIAITSMVYSTVADNPNALLCLSMIMQAEDYMAKHAIHVATLLCYFAHYLGCTKTQCETLALIGYLFDIGMLRVPEQIRHKKGKLGDEEQEQIKLHVAHSLELLAPLKLQSEYTLAIEQHHERLDGSGYPYACESAKIHKFSRMLAIVDTYDVLTSSHGYKLPLLPAAAMNELCKPELGYDQKLLLKFIRCMGVYPVGSLVTLSNKHLGMVMQTNTRAPISPVIKVFYNTLNNNFVAPHIIDLSVHTPKGDPQQTAHYAQNLHEKHIQENQPIEHCLLRVIKPVPASEYNINLIQVVGS